MGERGRLEGDDAPRDGEGLAAGTDRQRRDDGEGERDPDAEAHALAAARGGRAPEAGDLAFDAYLAFEPLETRARARDPGLVAAVERQFAEFKGAVRRGDVRGAERARNTIEAQLPSILDLTRAPSGKWATFFQSFLIILREGFEAILVIGAVCAFLLKTGNRARLRSIWVGTALGIVASALTAIVLQTVLRSMKSGAKGVELYETPSGKAMARNICIGGARGRD